MNEELASSTTDALCKVRQIFEDPSAGAYKIVTGQISVLDQPDGLSDELIKSTLLWIQMFNARGETFGMSPKDQALVKKIANRRGISGHDAGADVAVTEAISDLYGVVLGLQFEPVSLEQLQKISDAEKRVAEIEGNLTEAQNAAVINLNINLADDRARILSLLGNDNATEAAFLKLLDLAKASDQGARTNHQRRMLVKFCDWLSRNDADETLRLILPVIMENSKAAPPDVESLTLHKMLAEFFNRYGDRIESGVHLARLKSALKELGLDRLSLEHLDDTLEKWNAAICAQAASAVERYRLFNEAVVSHVSIAALAYQGPNGKQEDYDRMLAICGFLSDVRTYERIIKQDDANYLESVGEIIENTPVPSELDPHVDDFREFHVLMEAAEGDDPPETAQNALLNYCRKDGLKPDLRARALMRLAYISLNSEDWPEALDRFGSAGAIGRDNSIEDVQIEALKGMGTIKFALQEFAQSSAMAGAAIARVEAMRENLRAPYLASTFMADKFELYVLAINAARWLGDLDTMQSRIELVKARALQQPPGAIDAEKRETTRKALVSMREEAVLFHAQDHRRDQMLFRRRAAWEAMKLSQGDLPPKFDLARLQSRLGHSTTVLSYFFFSPSILLVTAITANKVQAERVAIEDEDGFYQTIARLQNAHHGATGISECLRRLAAVVFPAKLAPFIMASEQLIVCAHQSLHAVPFAALPWQGEPLIQNRTVGMVPNLTCLNRDDEPSNAEGLFAMATRETAVLPDRPLNHAEAEINTAVDIWTKASKPSFSLCGSELTLKGLHREESQNALRTASVVHIGTHGSDVNEPDAMRAPMEAHLFMNEATLDGMELSTFELNADVVILAACHAAKRAVSARGLKTLPSDAVYGLQAALHTAGAKSIIGAMWIVDDKTTATITKHIHKALVQGATPVQALRLAINQFRNGANLIESDPSFWAPYTAIVFGPVAFGLISSERNYL